MLEEMYISRSSFQSSLWFVGYMVMSQMVGQVTGNKSEETQKEAVVLPLLRNYPDTCVKALRETIKKQNHEFCILVKFQTNTLQ
jgi:hypothetical protein